MAPEAAVVVVERSPHEGLQPLVSLSVRDEVLTVKLVGPEKMARLGMQLHETDHLSKRGTMGITTLDASHLSLLLHFSTLIRHSPSSYVSALSNCGVTFVFVLL